MSEPSERLARLRDEWREPISEDERWLLGVAEAALRVVMAYPDACEEEGTVMEALRDHLYRSGG